MYLMQSQNIKGTENISFWNITFTSQVTFIGSGGKHILEDVKYSLTKAFCVSALNLWIKDPEDHKGRGRSKRM